MQDEQRGSVVVDLWVVMLVSLVAGMIVAAPVFLVYGAAGSGVVALPLSLVVFTGWIFAVVKGYRHLRSSAAARRGWVRAYEWLVLVGMFAWGLAVHESLLQRGCQTSSCDAGPAMFRPLAPGWIWPLAGLHVVFALAYAASRRRPERLSAGAELFVCASLLTGVAVHALVTVQFADLLWGALVVPLGLPVLAPPLAALLFGNELHRRLKARGMDAALAARAVEPAPLDSAYRPRPEGEPDPLPPAPAHKGWALASVFGSTAMLGAWTVAHAAFTGRAAAGFAVFTETCGHAFSRVPVHHVVVHDCHYLCTVAAWGSPSLVRPERVGVRRGRPIVVNRQLAVANAFEDLLHHRWPRFGRFARAVYDRLGLPVSRWVRWRWMADAIYLAMKPAEWAFYAFLVLADRDDPERRIDRMYR